MVRGPLAHLGFHKTGSTLIQHKVLTTDHGFHAPWPISYHVNSIVRTNPYVDRIACVRRAYADEFGRAEAQSLVPAISHEALLGHPFDGGNRYATTRYAEDLVEAFPDIHFVMVVREQRSMLASLYKHSISSAHTWGARSFLAERPGSAPHFSLEFLEYSWPALRLCDLVGKDRVTVLPFEWIATAPERFVAAFEMLGGRPISADVLRAGRVNPGLSALEADLKRHGNRFLPESARARSSVDQLVRHAARAGARLLGQSARAARETRLRERIELRVGDHYAASNAALDETFGLNLAQLGYALP